MDRFSVGQTVSLADTPMSGTVLKLGSKIRCQWDDGSITVEFPGDLVAGIHGEEN